MARLQILSKKEISKFEQALLLNEKERAYTFNIPSDMFKITNGFKGDNSFLQFTLLFGYFKIAYKFYEETLFHSKDWSGKATITANLIVFSFFKLCFIYDF